jgi:hypothetical protein
MKYLEHTRFVEGAPHKPVSGDVQSNGLLVARVAQASAKCLGRPSHGLPAWAELWRTTRTRAVGDPSSTHAL